MKQTKGSVFFLFLLMCYKRSVDYKYIMYMFA